MGLVSKLNQAFENVLTPTRPCGCNGRDRGSDTVEVGRVYDVERVDHGAAVEVKHGGRLIYRCLECGDLYLGVFLPGLISDSLLRRDIAVGDVLRESVSGEFDGDVKLPWGSDVTEYRNEGPEMFKVQRLEKIREVETVHGELSDGAWRDP